MNEVKPYHIEDERADTRRERLSVLAVRPSRAVPRAGVRSECAVPSSDVPGHEARMEAHAARVAAELAAIEGRRRRSRELAGG